MCGTVSAIGLTEPERDHWPGLRERFRVAGHLMAYMRGVLGDVEVAIVAAVTPQGLVKPLAILATPEPIAQEIRLLPGRDDAADGILPARIGDYDVLVLTEPGRDGRRRPLAVLTTPWIEQHLLLYARQLWHRR